MLSFNGIYEKGRYYISEDTTGYQEYLNIIENINSNFPNHFLMELKNYQKQVISDLEEFLSVLDNSESPTQAFQSYWTEQGLARPEVYFDRVP